MEVSNNRRSDLSSTTKGPYAPIGQERCEQSASSAPNSNSEPVVPVSNSATDPACDTHVEILDNETSSAPTQPAYHTDLMSAEDFLNLLASDVYPPEKSRINSAHLTVGFVGYPNVGKSSTMNALMGYKKTAVSATPGKTKHFQTLQVRPDLVLCDCPGLVLPSFSYSKSDLILSGILSVDSMRDYLSPVGLLCERIPRSALEFKYGIDLSNRDPENLNFASQSPPTPHQLLAAHAFSHGFRTAKGNPNYDRSARLILKDYVNGRLLYNHPPPNAQPHDFQYLGRGDECLFPCLIYSNLAKPFPKPTDCLQQHPTSSATDDQTGGNTAIPDPKLITAFDRMTFQKMNLTDSHIRCRKTLVIGNHSSSANVDGDDDDDDDTSVSSWITMGSTLNGSASVSVAGSTNYSVQAASKKPWRQMSNMKRSGAHSKRNDKLRRMYAQLDQHEQT